MQKFFISLSLPFEKPKTIFGFKAMPAFFIGVSWQDFVKILQDT
jgi:hypothetical protein